jgi:F420H(2)-dependent quinone reductase
MDTSPAWWLNLRSNPTAELAVGAERHRVTAEQVEGDERERLWRLMAQIHPTYDADQRRTSRMIPVVRLRPVA